MKKNIQIFLFAILAIVVCSCSEKDSAIKDLQNFTTKLSENYDNYGVKDWLKAEKKYNQIIDRLDKCQDQLTEEDKKKIVELNEECVKYYAKGMASVAAEGVEKAGDMLESVGGMVETVGGMVETVGGMADDVEKVDKSVGSFFGLDDDED